MAPRTATTTSLDFNAVYRTHASYVLTLASRFVGAQDAPDVAQRVWLRVYGALASFRGDAALTSWLYRIVQHVAYDCARHTARRPRTVAFDPRAHDRPDPSDHDTVDVDDRRATLDRALRELPPEQQAALLGWFTERPMQETAAALGVPLGTLKSRALRARRRVIASLQHVQETATH